MKCGLCRVSIYFVKTKSSVRNTTMIILDHHPRTNFINLEYLSICSIEFDRDNDYFAIAGVTKKIKVMSKIL